MNQAKIEINKIRSKIVTIKELQKAHKIIYADFYELLDSLPLTFKFRLKNIDSDIDGYWEKTIYANNSVWFKDEKFLYNSSFFNYIDNVLDAIEQNIESIEHMELVVNRKVSAETMRTVFVGKLGTDDRGRGGCYKDKRNGQAVKKMSFDDEPIHNLRRRKGEITLTLTKETIKKLYFKQNKSLEDIAKEYGTSRQNILRIMKKYGLDRRTQSKARIEAMKKGKFERFEYHEINEKFFSEWSPEMAWVLGLLFTDGNISGGSVLLTSVDMDLLEKVKKLLNSSKPIKKRTQSYDKSKHIFEFGFYREKMRNDLNKLGLQERKSLNMVFPDIPEEYMRHFIRGCWDGDGSIFFDQNKLVASYVSGSKKFIGRLVQELYKIGISKGVSYRYEKSGKRVLMPVTSKEILSNHPDGRFPLTIHMKNINAYSIKIATKENIERLFHYFYDGVDESMYLTRKYNVFVKGLKLEEKNETEQLTLDLDF